MKREPGARMNVLRAPYALGERSLDKYLIGVIRVIEDQITTLRPYNARYTGDHRSIFRKRYAEMITRVSLDRREIVKNLGW
jgi:hypothetical protein